MLTVKADFYAASEWAAMTAKQIPFATAMALTRTAQDVKRAEIATMKQVFDRPTRYVLDALYVQPASKATLTAQVGFKDTFFTRAGSTDAWTILGPHIEGGGRKMKKSEIHIFGNYYVPTKYAASYLDSHGNLPGGLLYKIQGQLMVQTDPLNNATNSRRSQANRANMRFFIQRMATGYKAVMLRLGNSRDAVPFLLEIPAPQYRKRFPYWDVADKTIRDRLPVNWDAAIQYAMGTTR